MTYDDIIKAAKHMLEHGSCPNCGGTYENPYPNVNQDDNNAVYCQHDFHWQCDDLDVLVNDTSQPQ